MLRIVSVLTHCVKIDAVDVRRDPAATLIAVIHHLHASSEARAIAGTVCARFTKRLTKPLQLPILG